MCKVPEAQPQAGEEASTVVLPAVFGREGSGVRVKILYLHGWNSVVGGVKPTYLKSHGHEIVEPSLAHEDFEAAIKTAQAAFDQHQPEVVVGSSRGGAVTDSPTSYSSRTTFTHSTCIWNFPGFLSLSMKPSPLIWSGSTGPMP